ncbi:MAG: precorrin-2 C(20)-methyltransferase [Actinomycetales bacterium]
MSADDSRAAGAVPAVLVAVGVGPGDPELITLRGARLIGAADVVAYFRGASSPSVARGIAADLIAPSAIEEELRYPVTTGRTDHPGGYYGVIAEFYDECAERLAAHLTAGRRVVVLAEGDPLFYSTFMYLQDRLKDRFPVEIVPGVTSVSGASAAAAQALCRHEDVVTVLPGTLGVPELARRLADTDAAVVMKLGRTFPDVVQALRQAGVLERAVYVERATGARERVLPVAEVDPARVPYMSMVIVPGQGRKADSAGRFRSAGVLAPDASQRDGGSAAAASADGPQNPESGGRAVGRVSVIGLGPGPDHWLTPQADSVLAQVSAVYGYAPYVARVPVREGLRLCSSGNTVEVDRAREALEAAAAGEHVAVVSGGDAGVFGMASAVFEAAQDERFAAVPIEVLPGVTAANAAAALAGAPLGADYCVISLSDRLKPWEVLRRRLQAAASADLAIAIYNPRSNSRPHQLAQAKADLLEVVDGDRVVVIARHVGRPGQSLRVTTLADLDPDAVDMACLVIVGASSTQVRADNTVWTPRFVR